MSTAKSRIRDDLINSGLLKPDSNKLESQNRKDSKNRKDSFDSAIESRRKEVTPKWVKNRDAVHLKYKA